MRKLRIVLSENKKLLNEGGVFAGREDQFQEFLALEKMLQTSSDEKIKSVWEKIKIDKKYTTGTPFGNTANYKFFTDSLQEIERDTRAISNESFIDFVKQTDPDVQSFFNSFGSATDDVSKLNPKDLIGLLQEFYKATILPLLFLNEKNKINSADYTYGEYMSQINQQIKPRLETVRKAAETVSSRKTGTLGGLRTAVLGSGEKTFIAARTELAKLYANMLSAIVAKKEQSDNLSKSSVQRGGGGGEGGGGERGGGEAGGGPGGGAVLSSDTPLSITRQQKLKTGAGGENEMPLVTQMQKLGVSQKTAQLLSKRIADYLKQRNIPLAEAVQSGLLEKLITEADSSFASRKAARKAALDAKTKKGKPLNVAGPKNTPTGVSGGVSDAARKRIGGELSAIRAEIAKLENEVNNATSPEGKRMAERDLEQKKKELAAKEKDVQTYKDTDKAAKNKIDAQTKQNRSDIRGVGSDMGVIGKILSRFVSDNQKILTTDANLKKMLENPAEFKKFVVNLRNLLKRQMSRRGYDDTQIKKLLENYNLELNVRNLLLESAKKNAPLLREYREHIETQLVPYMQKQIGFNKPPVINFLDDAQNATDPMGKTAFYDPQSMEISVYTTGRHPKDIMRSVAHEVIHHAQNCRGQLDPQRMGEASEGYAQKNPYLRKLEEEAYLLGNMTFRDWEDGMKTGQLNEAHDCNKVHPNKSHAAYKRDDEAKNQEKPLDEWINEERWDLLMKRFKIVSEKRFANDPKLDKDGDGKPKWADKNDDDAESGKRKDRKVSDATVKKAHEIGKEVAKSGGAEEPYAVGMKIAKNLSKKNK